MATLYSPKVVTDGLTLYLDAGNIKSYPGTGTVWTDLSNNGRTGTLVNSPAFNSANSGSIVFDGTDDLAQLPATSFGITTAFTIEVVCKPTSAPATGMFNFKGSGYDRGIMCHWPWSDGNCYFDIYSTSGSFYRWYKTMSITNVIAMYHFYVDSTGTQYVRQNGVLLSPTGVTGSASPFNINLGESNVIGAFYYSGGLQWPGNMYSFKIYNRTLTNSEMLQNYNAVKGRFGL
jgi:hypothetical protein